MRHSSGLVEQSSAGQCAGHLDSGMASRKLKFQGSFKDLQDRLLPVGLDGDWEEKPNGVWKFKCRNRAGVLWSQTRGTIWFDVPAPQAAVLRQKVERALADDFPDRQADPTSTILVVHGRESYTLDQLERVFRDLDLAPSILYVAGSGVDALNDALERMAKSPHGVFGIVLMTPDDMGYAKTETPEDAQPRARPDLILDMGMLLGSLSPRRCAVLQKGNVELPTKMRRATVIPFNEHIREAVPKLVERLQQAGFQLDAAAIRRAQA